MKKFWGTASLAIALGAFAVWAILRIHNFDGPHALVWRVPLDLHIYVLAGLDIVDGGQLLGREVREPRRQPGRAPRAGGAKHAMAGLGQLQADPAAIRAGAAAGQ